MKVIAHDPVASESVSLEELLRQSDVVSLHCPLTPDNRGADQRRAAQAHEAECVPDQHGSRPMIVEQDLADALNEKKLGGAGLDVLPIEPPRNGSPLMDAKTAS